jgi:hypothetical protein
MCNLRETERIESEASSIPKVDGISKNLAGIFCHWSIIAFHSAWVLGDKLKCTTRLKNREPTLVN